MIKALNELISSNHYAINSDWLSFAAIAISFNYANWLLSELEETGFDMTLSPYYIAIQAIEIERTKNAGTAEIYLRNQAIEKAEFARSLIQSIKVYL